jgi:hypothetical protein
MRPFWDLRIPAPQEQAANSMQMRIRNKTNVSAFSCNRIFGRYDHREAA